MKELTQLARAGAPQLALRRMDVEQPAAADDLVQWTAWEQERLQILASQALFPELIARVDSLPDAVDERFRRQALALKADAQLQLGQAHGARATVRALLWSHAGGVQAGTLARWRRLVVRSYLLEEKNEDARLALLRYRQDFGDEDPQWRWLSARVMLQGGHADSAFKLLQKDETPQGLFLRYAAQLQVAPQQAAAVQELALGQAQQAATPPLQSAFWGLAAMAAGQARQHYRQIEYLEHALSLPFDRELMHGVLELDADQLWDAYLQQGKRIGNREQKLLGNDEDWYFPATEALEKDPLRARALFSVLSEYGSDARRRSLAHEYLIGMLDDLPDGKRLVRRLYLESRRYTDVANLPPVIRYRLIDEALESGELQTASRLMAGLAEPPAGADRFAWNLRRARVAIFTGEVESGVEILQQLAKQDAAWDRQKLDRLLQVVFDLQTLQSHQQALALFTALLDKPLDPQQRRELLFWMADSLQELDQYEQAAYLYLKSATLMDATAMDPWAQTARYRAAQALAEAGLLDDARQIYNGLLRATRDAGRKAVLQNEIQRLHLVSASGQKEN
ncbi:MAG: tol-pal system YbgF family protein [Thiogranum sp.]